LIGKNSIGKKTRHTMTRKNLLATAVYFLMLAACILIYVAPASAVTWGADYFPNVPVITQEGKTVHFYDDVLKGKKVVVISSTPPAAIPARLRPPAWPRSKRFWPTAWAKISSSSRSASIRSTIRRKR
jgi:hypothetical protein